jgi:hypothetical protein
MPMRSQAQRRYLWSQRPDVARRFERETPRGKKLPEYVRSNPLDSDDWLRIGVAAALVGVLAIALYNKENGIGVWGPA